MVRRETMMNKRPERINKQQPLKKDREERTREERTREERTRLI